jgi:hypothetical protein
MEIAKNVKLPEEDPRVKYGWQDGNNYGIVAGWEFLTPIPKPKEDVFLTAARRIIHLAGWFIVAVVIAAIVKTAFSIVF